MAADVRECELDVEAARAKLARDLGRLRSPDTLDAFTGDLKNEAIQAKDALVDKARASAENAAMRFINDIKVRAAANPIAALAIGAGIGWRLIRNPPIATALIGAGLFSLWQTQVESGEATNEELIAKGKQRLREQLSSAGAEVRDRASEAGAAAIDKLTELSEHAREQAGAWIEQSQPTAKQAAGSVRHRAANIAESVTVATKANSDDVRDKYHFDETAAGVRTTSQVVGDGSARNQILLGVAGAAVAAALGIAVRRRVAEDA